MKRLEKILAITLVVWGLLGLSAYLITIPVVYLGMWLGILIVIGLGFISAVFYNFKLS